MHEVTYDDVRRASERLAGRVRPITVTAVEAAAPAEGGAGDAGGPRPLWLGLELLQHTGSFKVRGALNFLLASVESGAVGEAGVAIASGGNAGLACAWAARRLGVHATVFVPETAPPVKVARLRGYRADVRLVGREYAEAALACEEFTARTGALASHAYDHPLIAAGAGTLVEELVRRVPGLDTVVVAAGGGGLFAGVAAAAAHHGLHTVAVEPEGCDTLNAALRAGELVDVAVDSVAADSLGARRATAMALSALRRADTSSVLVPDEAIVRTRRALWQDSRLAVEHAAATALAALPYAPALAGPDQASATGAAAYTPRDGEVVAVVLSGGNTDPADLSAAPPGA